MKLLYDFMAQPEDIHKFMDDLSIPCPHCEEAMIAQPLEEFGPVLLYRLSCECGAICTAQAVKVTDRRTT